MNAARYPRIWNVHFHSWRVYDSKACWQGSIVFSVNVNEWHGMTGSHTS